MNTDQRITITQHNSTIDKNNFNEGCFSKNGRFRQILKNSQNFIHKIEEFVLKILQATFSCYRKRILQQPKKIAPIVVKKKTDPINPLSVSQKVFIDAHHVKDLYLENNTVLLDGHIWHITSRNLRDWQTGDTIQIYKDEHHPKGIYLLINDKAKNSYYAFTEGNKTPEIAGNCTELIKSKWTGYIEFIDRKNGYLYIQPSNLSRQSFQSGQIDGGKIPDHWRNQDKVDLLNSGDEFWLKNFYRSDTLKLEKPSDKN